jgi:hypothetical protein
VERRSRVERFANRTIALFRESAKPFIVVVDGSRLYDPMADYLQRAGVPVFRSRGSGHPLLRPLRHTPHDGALTSAPARTSARYGCTTGKHCSSW